MPLNLIFGDNQFQSRNHLNQLIDSAKKHGIKDIEHLAKNKISLEKIIQTTESKSFFGSERLLVLELLFSISSKSDQKNIIKYLQNLEAQESHIIIWESKKLTPSQVKSLSNFTPHEFRSSPTIFKFLDSLRPSNQRQFIPLFQQSCNKDSAEFVFFMLLRHLRGLVLSQTTHFKGADWQKGKLSRQYKSFSESSILNLHTQCFQLDKMNKKGLTILNFQQELELILLNI